MSDRTSIELSPAIAEAARWVQEQLDRNPFSDVGFTATAHEGQVKRVSYHVTTKAVVPPDGGSRYGRRGS